MCGDRAWGMNLFEQMSAGSLSLDPKELAYRFARPWDEATYITMTTDWVTLVSKPWSDLLGGQEATAAKWDAQQSPLHTLSNISSRSGGIVIEAPGEGKP